MKLGTVLATLSAATLVVAQPAVAGTRSADSLPSAGAPVKIGAVRGASRIGQREELVGVPVAIIIAGIVVGFVILDALGVFHVIWDDNGPDSP